MTAALYSLWDAVQLHDFNEGGDVGVTNAGTLFHLYTRNLAYFFHIQRLYSWSTHQHFNTNISVLTLADIDFFSQLDKK